ncbi:MAG: ABC transporter permease [Oscillospiraceae bacterium]|nr:ABC transporter permease [Oscillospiraceae bacterium]
MITLLNYTLAFAAILLLVALGGCVSEHSGVINLGLEGIMVIGALGGALVMKFMPNAGGFGLFLCVMLASIVFGVIYSSLLAVACINLKADQTIVGTALNMLGTALATVIVKSMNLSSSGGANTSSVVKYENKQAFFSNLGSFELNWFMVVALVMLAVVFVLLYKTKFGLRLRACGEHPQAAASVGINVFKMRWAGVLLSGLLGGLGGITYITTGVSEWKFEEGVFGFGFLSLAVMIFGAWDPVKIGGAAILFGFFRALGRVYNGIDFLKSLNIPPALYSMLPYIVCLIVLAFTSKNSKAPKAEGIPYDKGMR